MQAYVISQYPIVIFVIIFSLMTQKSLSRINVLLVTILVCFGFISFCYGLYFDFIVSGRGVLIPIIFFIVLNSQSYKLLHILFIYSLFVIIIESLLYYTGNAHMITSTLNFIGSSWYVPAERHLVGSMDMILFKNLQVSPGAIKLYRPIGAFVDLSLSGLFIATTMYIYGHKYIGGLFIILAMTLQSIIAYSVVFINKRSPFIIFLIITIVGFFILNSGHLNYNYPDTMINIYINTFIYDFDSCYIIGCSTNYIETTVNGNKVWSGDNGFIKVFYYFGIPWLFIYLYYVFRNSITKILPLIYFITIIKDPVGYGMLGTILLAISINYYNKYIFNGVYISNGQRNLVRRTK
jgi:hypothetical protein